MKQYLAKNENGVFEVNTNGFGIEIPEGAECAVKYPETLTFYKNDFSLFFNKYSNGQWLKADYQESNSKIIWKKITYKEFLNSKDNYKLVILPEHAGDDEESGLIEVPEWAYYAYYSSQQSNVVFTNIDTSYFYGGTLWQRHTQPEELPFVDDDNVNHPSHYTTHPSGIECIEITRHHDFAIGNAIKYLWRAGLKNSDNEIQDLEKAVWYIQDKIKQLKGRD